MFINCVLWSTFLCKTRIINIEVRERRIFMTFGERLKDLLERRDIKQNELAKQLNLTKSTLSGYINDYRLPNLITVVQIAEILGVTTDFLLGCDSRPESVPLSREELTLLMILRSLDREKQDIIYKMCNVLSKK